jgi:hypothetical protein
MSDYVPDVGKGNLHVNQLKKEAKHPDFTGSVNIEGRIALLAAYKNVDKNGNNYISIKHDINAEEYAKRKAQGGYEGGQPKSNAYAQQKSGGDFPF